MNVSDVLTVLSIAIAALSITYSSDRKIWLYKFSKRDWIVCGIWLIVITYLIHFDKFYSTGWYFPQLMRTGNLYPNAQEWAFLLTIVVIGYFVIKLCKKRFPKSRYKGLVNYYASLSRSNFLLLIGYLREFHQKEIEKSIDAFNKDMKAEEEKNDDLLPWEQQSSGNSSITLSGLILNRIIFNRTFVTESFNNDHLFFLSIVCRLKYDNIVNSKECVEFYYRHLIDTRNAYLTEGLNQTNNYISEGEFRDVAYRLDDSEFSRLTFENLDFTCKFEVWKAFGEEGMKDAETNKLYAEKVDEWNDKKYLESPARICFTFYDIFIRELMQSRYGIHKGSHEQQHIYLFYICRISENAFKRIRSNFEETYAEKLFFDMLSYMYNWLQCLAKHNLVQHRYDIFHIVECVITIGEYPEKLKVSTCTWFIESFFNLTERMNNNDEFVQTFIQQIVTICSKDEEKRMKEGWKQIDTFKYSQYPKYKLLGDLF